MWGTSEGKIQKEKKVARCKIRIKKSINRMRRGGENMEISIIGTGYVGLVTGTCLSD